MLNYKQSIRTLTGLLMLFTSSSLFAAPSIPKELLNSSLIYCTNTHNFSFNPQTSEAGTHLNVVTEQIYNKLFEIDGDNIKGVLAKSYYFSPDRKTLYIQLRQGVKFQTTPWFTPQRDFDADDVLFSLNRILNPQGSLPAFDSHNIQSLNPQYQAYYELAKQSNFPYFDGIAFNQRIKTISKISPYEIKIELTQPDDSLLSHLASQYAVMLSYEYALQLNADNNRIQLDLLPVGTGPYQLNDSVRNQYVRLVRNDDYWGKVANVKNMIIDLSASKTGRLEKLLNQECDIVTNPEVAQLGLLQNTRKHFRIQATKGMNLAYLAFNTQHPKINQVDIRRALAQGIDRQRLLKVIYYGTAELANSVLPQNSWALHSTFNSPDYSYNPEAARKTLKDKHLNLTMWVVNQEQAYNPNPVKMAEVIKYDLKQVGVNVNIRYINQTYLEQQLSNGKANYDMILSGWLADSPDPDSFLRPILACHRSDNITNLAHWCSSDFDHFLNVALSSPNRAIRVESYNEAKELVNQQVPLLPIASVKRILLYSDRVQGVKSSPFDNIHFSDLSINEGDK